MEAIAAALTALATAIASLSAALAGKVITEQTTIDGLVTQANAAKAAVDAMIAELA